jgi:Tfp pilus assembly protein FimV
MERARLEPVVRRWAAPAAFLLAVTIAVLLVRAGLEGSGGSSGASPPPPPPPSTTTTAQPPKPSSPPRYYVIRSGDTLDGVALTYHTTVERLRALNPGVDPTALHVGQRIRVPAPR